VSKKFIISGVSPGPAGVGRVMQYLIANVQGATFLHPPFHRRVSVKQSLSAFQFFTLLKGSFLFIIHILNQWIFELNLWTLNGKHLIVLHPQTVGFTRIKKLISRNRVSLYLMDNSFFCIRSYNYLNNHLKPCLLCLNLQYQNSKAQSCSSFPVNYTYDEYFDFIEFLNRNTNRINFFTQNRGQEELLKMQFGPDIQFKQIGLLTSDMFENINDRAYIIEGTYDIVFHGDDQQAKGSLYLFEIAKKLPQYSFLFPFSPFADTTPNNTFFIPMTWTSGLREYVQNSIITFCPSIWSAPIEGSVVKTLKMGVAIGLFDAEYSFSKEIPNEVAFKLTGILANDIDLLKSLIESKRYIQMAKLGKDHITSRIDEMIKGFDSVFKVN